MGKTANGHGEMDSAPELASAAAPQTIDQVRELLFGTEQRSLEQRINDLSARMESQVQDLESQLASVQSALETQAGANRDRHDDQVRQIGEGIKALGESVIGLHR